MKISPWLSLGVLGIVMGIIIIDNLYFPPVNVTIPGTGGLTLSTPSIFNCSNTFFNTVFFLDCTTRYWSYLLNGWFFALILLIPGLYVVYSSIKENLL